MITTAELRDLMGELGSACDEETRGRMQASVLGVYEKMQAILARESGEGVLSDDDEDVPLPAPMREPNLDLAEMTRRITMLDFYEGMRVMA